MKKLFALILTLTILMMAAVPAMAEEPIVIEFWHSFGSGANLECIETIIADFNASQSKYVVEGSYQGGYTDIFSKVTVGYAAGEVPAVTFLDSVDCPRLIQNGMLVNLSDYAKTNDPDYDFSAFFDGLMNYGTGADGDYYALPMGRSTPLMYLNMDIIKEATGGEAVIPATRTELVELLKLIREKCPDKIPMTTPLVCWYFANFVTSAGYGFISSDGNTCYLKDGALQSFEFFEYLKNEGLFQAEPVGDSSWVNNTFISGDIAVIFQSTGNMTSFMQNCEFDLQAAFLPADQKYSVATGGNNLMIINKNDDEVIAGAWEFIKYCTSLEVNAYVNEATGYILTHKDSETLESVQQLWAEKPMYKIAYDQLVYVEDLYVSPYFAELNQEVVNLLSALMQDDKMTAQDAYDQLMLVCDNLFPGGCISESEAA